LLKGTKNIFPLVSNIEFLRLSIMDSCAKV
jgi:hypothetical protein